MIIDGRVCRKPAYKSKKEVQGSIEISHPATFSLEPREMDIPVFFQDEHLAIIYKDSGITVHPGAGTRDDTLVHGLLKSMVSLSEGNEESRPGIVHRLDRDTDGLMVIAKTTRAHTLLAEMFSGRRITKEYRAIIWGRPSEQQAELKGYIDRNPKNRKLMKFTEQAQTDNAREAALNYTVADSFNNFSLVEIDLITGRTHQIRATFAAIGHPVAGDPYYSDTKRQAKRYKTGKKYLEILNTERLMLTACRLAFIHPLTEQPLDFKLPLSGRFTRLIEAVQS